MDDPTCPLSTSVPPPTIIVGVTTPLFIPGYVCSWILKKMNLLRVPLWLGIGAIKPGARIGDIGYAIQHFSEGQGYQVVREFTGHGIGRTFHTAPSILHYGKPGTGDPLLRA